MLYKTLTSIILLLSVVASRQRDDLSEDYSVSGGLYDLEVEPDNAKHKVGETVTFECRDKENSVIDDNLFTWRHNDSEIGTGKKLKKLIQSMDDAGEYVCVVGDSSSTSTLSVNQEYNPTEKIYTATRNADGNSVSIICSFENQPIDSNQYTFEWFDKAGKKISNLPNDVMAIEDLKNKQPLTCRAMHRNGKFLQAGLTFESLISPSVLTNVIHNVKANIKFDNPVDGQPLLLSNYLVGDYDSIETYTWKKDGIWIGDSPNYKIERLDDRAKGTYTCDIVVLIDNSRVKLHTTVNLNNRAIEDDDDDEDDDFDIRISPSPLQVKVNDLTELHCTISNSKNYFASSIKWTYIPRDKKGEIPLEGWTVQLTSASTSTIKKRVQNNDFGIYFCKVEGTYKVVKSKLKEIKGDWTIRGTGDETSIYLTLDPQEQTVKLNEQFRLICEKKGENLSNMLLQASTNSGVRLNTQTIGLNQLEITGIATQKKIVVECSVHGIKREAIIYAGCGENFKSCPDGRCIFESASCDGNIEECDPIIRKCNNHNGKSSSKITYNVNWECDGENDCGNGYDEADCQNRAREICGKEYSCPSGNKNIPMAYVCDGELDCNGGNDEHDCSKPSITSTIEDKYKVREGSTVTLECRAMGRPAPRIIWRYNWGCLPGQLMGDSQIPYLNSLGIDRFRISSTIENCDSNTPTVVSTLTIQNFRNSDAGFYNCEAISGQNRVLSGNYDVQILKNY